jgi:hypothetical protein
MGKGEQISRSMPENSQPPPDDIDQGSTAPTSWK